MKALIVAVLCVCCFAAGSEDDRLPNKCEVCKFLTMELQEALEKTGRSKEVLEVGEVLDTGKRRRKIKYNTSETRLTEAVDNICERILQYNVHAERPGSLRYAKGSSQTMTTLKNLVNKGVKVDLGMPYELWDEPSAEVTNMKKQCETMLELYEEVVEDWYFHHQDQRLESFLCENHVLKTSERECLKEVWKGDMGDEGGAEEATIYLDQTKPLLTFSDLAALEASSQSEDPAANEEHQALVVSCQEDSIEIVMRPHLLDPNPPVELVGLRLGPSGSGWDRCTARCSADGEFIIRAPLAECGSRVTFTDGAVLYSNMLLFFFPGSSPGDTFQVEGAAVPVLCQHKRRYMMSSGALRPTWTYLISVHSAHLSLDFYLSLIAANWTSERNSPVYFMSETVNIQASIDHHHHHPPLRLYVGSCVATLTPDVNSHPRYPFIDRQGCFTDSQLSRSGSHFLPRVRDELLRIQLEPFLFHQDRRNSIYITCYLEALPILKKDPKTKACSFIAGS
ncbi:hypothetical protein CHARACLAT_011907 [Characodon lateralis]|uniref:ZP domain-containing protein n=1 Tax=Characodon lateralis TaxID=208331 RepID=A0ABU7EU19_9TELE|nr:hypothetical protein [Characodon lateralis]